MTKRKATSANEEAMRLGLVNKVVPHGSERDAALALATLLPLSMVSDIFINTPDLPAAMSAIGWAFPLRHMAAVTVVASVSVTVA
mgnify:CR=1 FL=1